MRVFIAGPRKISKLNKKVKERLENIMSNDLEVFLGDANGIDKALQKYFSNNEYNKVKIYAVNGQARNNIGNWEVKDVKINRKTKDFLYYTAKDKEMAKKADYGFMIWNGKSKGTLNNIINLAIMNKKIVIYFTPEKKFYKYNDLNGVKKILNKCNNKTKELFNDLMSNKDKMQMQMDFE